jgi:sterol 3beta-glucosyltransferase
MSGGLVCFTTVGGSMGDVRPLIALALAVRASGYEVIFLGDRAFEGAAWRAGLTTEWFNLSDIPQTFHVRTISGQRWLWGRGRRFRDRWMYQEMRRHRQERIAAFWEHVGGPNSPRIVAAIGGVPAFEMLLGFGAQCARIVSSPWPFQPSTRFSLDHPNPSLRERITLWRQKRDFETRHRRRFCDELFHLVSASPTIFPRPDDWSPNMQVTGYIALDEDHAAWTPPPRLRAFLDQGPPPVYVGFGSYPFLFGPRGEQLARAILDGCRRRHRRCLLHTSDLSPAWASEQVFILDETVPFGWLLPRCAAVVHHGGYGTVHCALTAQRPMIVYPFQTDQFFWAARMGELGVGQGFTARLRQLTASRLERDLAVVLDGRCQARAEQLGTAMRHEQGLPVQLAAITSIIEHVRRGRRPVEWRGPETVEHEYREATLCN